MIKVIIERQIAEGLETPYEKAIADLLKTMTSAPGYLSGESLIDLKQTNHYVVIALWASEDAWLNWSKSAQRKHLLSVIAPFLQTDEKFTLLRPLTYHQQS